MSEWFESLTSSLSDNAKYIFLSIIITILSYVVYRQVKRLLTWLREKDKVSPPVIDTIAPILQYSVILIGFTFLLLSLSFLFDVYNLVSIFVPSIMIGSIIVIITWFSYQVTKYAFSWVRSQKRIPIDMLNIAELIIKYGLIILGFAFLTLNIVATIMGSEIVFSQIIGWFATHGGRIALIVISVILLRIISKFLGAFFEDLKWRTSLQPDIVDLANTSTRILIYLIVGLMVLSSLFTLMGAEEFLPLLTSVFSVLFGVGFSFAAAGAIGNFIAGLVLSNWKPYDIGDRVEVGKSIYGDVMEFDVLFTKIKTIKEEIISVPNLSVLTNKIMNYSSLGACVVHSRIGVGYEYSRQTVENVLLNAAYMTEDILREPKPYVLIPELANYVVMYEINAYTDKPNRLAKIYSDLHKNILDTFNQAQIPLVSPTLIEISENKK